MDGGTDAGFLPHSPNLEAPPQTSWSVTSEGKTYAEPEAFADPTVRNSFNSPPLAKLPWRDREKDNTAAARRHEQLD